QLIDSVFFSSSGGMTENSGEVWPRQLPYLRSVVDYDQDSPVYRWTVAFDDGQLQSAFPETGGASSIEPISQTSTGRLRQVLVRGPGGELSLSGGQLRQRLGLRSSFVRFRPPEDPDTVMERLGSWLGLRPSLVAEGRGYGHGVGLSQWGTYGMALKGVSDVERLCGRLAMGVGNARDLKALGTSVAQWPKVSALLEKSDSKLLQALAQPLANPALLELGNRVVRALVDEPPLVLKEGGLFQKGYHAELDTLTELSTSGKDYLAALEVREREKTGISSLKVRYNKVFGYYLEVTKANLHLVPAEYFRKQTTVGAERFVTPELKEYEEKVLTAEEKRGALEFQLFNSLREQVVAQAAGLKAAADAVATLDGVLSLARCAAEYGYVRPMLDESEVLEIEAGRHPVVERMLQGERFVPNDIRLDGQNAQVQIITGPNMAGKSTVMRQVALTVVMAQAGSFVPAKRARIGRCDRVFTRVGASDNLARGQSTFMVEMSETANILHHATSKSLLVLDEIGRGTSTFDGVSIAWAVAEHLHNHVGARTLFATHYHELT
ncbi:MAG: DNA mismatch repair protein MutS, partial [Synechococcaceae bacterium WB9_2_170]|nr:DNA mismatch repair protein MutS [Synechococcaceae bacterium WB9_2_170]